MGKGCALLIHVLNCLEQCMVHDADGLFQKEVFKILLQPLVDQVRCARTLGVCFIEAAYGIGKFNTISDSRSGFQGVQGIISSTNMPML